jgi:hypothetical protein
VVKAIIAVSVPIAAVATAQWLTGAPLRLAREIPAWVWSAAVVLTISVPLTLTIARRRSASSLIGRRAMYVPATFGELTLEFPRFGVLWRCHVPFRRPIISSRALELSEISGLLVELPPRCPRSCCSAELVEEARRWPHRGVSWRCPLGDFSGTFGQPAVVNG